MLPTDPLMLLSVVNTCLRDHYPSLSALCEDRGVDPESIVCALGKIGYTYDETLNRFV